MGEEFAVAEAKGILKNLPSRHPLTAAAIIARVLQDRATYMERYTRKHKSEQEYYTKSKATAGYVEET